MRHGLNLEQLSALPCEEKRTHVFTAIKGARVEERSVKSVSTNRLTAASSVRIPQRCTRARPNRASTP